jgi:hypothetical protein
VQSRPARFSGAAAKNIEFLPDLIHDMAGNGKISGIPAAIPDLPVAGNRPGELGIPDVAGMGGIGNTYSEIRFGRDRVPEFPPRCRGFGPGISGCDGTGTRDWPLPGPIQDSELARAQAPGPCYYQ